MFRLDTAADERRVDNAGDDDDDSLVADKAAPSALFLHPRALFYLPVNVCSEKCILQLMRRVIQ